MTSLTYEQTQYSGSGVHTSHDKSIIIALAEVLERVSAKENFLKSTNGLAAHSNIAEAKNNAVAELIERDLLFCHLLTSSKLRPLSESLQNNLRISFQDFLRSISAQLHFYKLNESGSLILAQLRVLNSYANYQYFYGIGFKKELRASGCHAVLEALKSYLLHNKKQSPSNNERFNIARIENEDTKYYEIRQPHIIYNQLKIPTLFQELNMHVIQATSRHLQSPYNHLDTQSEINLSRLNQFLGKDIKNIVTNHLREFSWQHF